MRQLDIVCIIYQNNVSGRTNAIGINQGDVDKFYSLLSFSLSLFFFSVENRWRKNTTDDYLR